MKSSEYWEKRAEEVASQQYVKADEYELKLLRTYEQATDHIQQDIEQFYMRYADANGIRYAEAVKRLTGAEHRRSRLSLNTFKERASDKKWKQQLDNIYIKSRVSRLQALQTQIQCRVRELGATQEQGTKQLLGGIYKDTYYRTLYELQQGTGIGVSFARVDHHLVEKVLSQPWVGDHFSGRIWSDKEKLIRELETNLAHAFIRGDSLARTTQIIQKRMDVSWRNASRLIQTEAAHIVGEATFAGYQASGVVEKYEILATLDKRTSSICRGMDGKIFALSEKQEGMTYPPFHPRCRTTTVAYFDDHKFDEIGERAARGEDGKTYYVPANVTYEQWKQKNITYEQWKPKYDKLDSVVEYRKFASVEEIKKWEQQVTAPWLERLTAHEAHAITTYTGNSYQTINHQLRTNTTEPAIEELAKEITSGLQKFERNENVVVFRGLRQNIFGVPAEEMKGIVFTDPAFVSTSLLETASFTGPIQMEIRVPMQFKGAAINPISMFKDAEYEFLLDKGTTFRIVEAKQMDGQIKIIAEVVEDD